MRPAVVLWVLFLAGCPSDFDRFELVCDAPHSSGDGGGGGGDGGFGNDGAVAECACDSGTELPPGCAGCDCPLPAVFAVIESRDGSQQNAGKIAVVSLATGVPVRCGDLSGGGTLPSQPSTVAWIPPASVAVGSDGKMALLNPKNDQYRWVHDPPCCTAGWPRDVFPLSSPAGLVVGAGYYLQVGDSDIRYVETYDLVSGLPVDKWELNETESPLKLGLSIESMWRSPLDPTHLIVYKGSDYAAADIAAPFDDMPAYPDTYLQALPSGFPDSIHATRSGDLSRVVWVSGTFGASPEAIYYVNDTGGGPMLAGPLRCDSLCAAPAVFWHAVSDPTDDTGVIAVCDADDAGDDRHIVRFDQAGACEMVLDGTTLPPLSRPYRLDVAY